MAIITAILEDSYVKLNAENVSLVKFTNNMTKFYNFLKVPNIILSKEIITFIRSLLVFNNELQKFNIEMQKINKKILKAHNNKRCTFKELDLIIKIIEKNTETGEILNKKAKLFLIEANICQNKGLATKK